MTERTKKLIDKIKELGYIVMTNDGVEILEPHTSNLTGKEYLLKIRTASHIEESFFKEFLESLYFII